MAEAAPPRKTTTYNRFSTMASQNERYNTKEDEMFWLENIMRTAPHKLHSVPGPRDVAFFPIPVTTCPDQFPGPQDLPQVCCYNVDSGWGSGGRLVGINHCGMFAHADDDGSFWFTISENTGFGVGTYLPNSTTAWHLLLGQADCSLTEIDPPPILFTGYTITAFSGQTPQSGTDGKSDEKCYQIISSNITPGLSGASGTTGATVFFGETTGLSAFFFSLGDGAIATNAWTKQGNQYYSAYHSGAGNTYILRFPMPAPNGTVEDLAVFCQTCLPGFNPGAQKENIIAMHKTANFLWVLAFANVAAPWTSGNPTGYRLFKLDPDLNPIDQWDLSTDPNFSTPWGLHVHRDADLIFMVQSPTLQHYTIGYFNPTTALTTVIGTATSICTEAGSSVGTAGQSGFQYAKNYFYLSYAGFGLGVTNVLKLGPLVCPSNPALPWQN